MMARKKQSIRWRVGMRIYGISSYDDGALRIKSLNKRQGIDVPKRVFKRLTKVLAAREAV